jgi:hypothetical protein
LVDEGVTDIGDLGRCSHVTGNQEVTDPGLEPEYALL